MRMILRNLILILGAPGLLIISVGTWALDKNKAPLREHITWWFKP